MGTAIFATSTDIILELSARAIIGASIALLFILLLGNAFKHSKKAKQILFILVVGVVLCASSVLLTTAFVYMRQVTDIFYMGAFL